MKTIKNKVTRTKHVIVSDGYFRRLVKKLFKGWIRRQKGNCQKEIEKIAENLQRIEGSIEIIARHMARRRKV